MSGGTCAKPMSMTSGSCAWIGRRTDRRPSLPQTSGPNVVLMANVANQALELHLQEERTQPANRKARLQRDLIDVARLAVEIVEHVRLLTRGRQRLARLEVRLPDGQLEVGQDVFCRRCKDRSIPQELQWPLTARSHSRARNGVDGPALISGEVGSDERAAPAWRFDDYHAQ